MRWMKIGPACDYLGGIAPKILYAATRSGRCRVARIGAGRNYLWCEEFLDEYALHAAKAKDQTADPTIALVRPRGVAG